MLEKLLSQLNSEQRAAVEETEGYVRVAAGAGSGKTRVLTCRYIYIAKALGVAPEHMLSVTFTNKAAWEMRKRIRARMPDEDGGWILTFHSACHKILKQDISLLAYPSNFMVLDEEDQKSILQRIYDENGLTLKDFYLPPLSRRDRDLQVQGRLRPLCDRPETRNARARSAAGGQSAVDGSGHP